jgi:hypothetical protein
MTRQDEWIEFLSSRLFPIDLLCHFREDPQLNKTENYHRPEYGEE